MNVLKFQYDKALNSDGFHRGDMVVIAIMNHVALKLKFETDKFLLTGPLPEDANAGNQFYGGDFAKWICATMSAWNLSYGDEDWGWEVFSTRGKAPELI